MICRQLVFLVACFIGFVLVAGCVTQDDAPVVSEVLIGEPVTSAATTYPTAALIVVSSEGSTETPPDSRNLVTVTSVSHDASQNGLFGLDLAVPPDNLAVSVSAQKDPIYHTISVTFNGGPGQQIVSSVLVGVTFSDGHVETEELSAISGSTITFEGTEGMDVVEVVVSYMNGEYYKILHESLGFIRPNLDAVPVETEVPVTPSSSVKNKESVAPLPNDRHISVKVEKEPIYKEITTTFGGGFGQNLVREIVVIVSLSDGSIHEGLLEPRIGATHVVKGTNGTDHVQVIVTYSTDETYQILDADVGSRGGVVLS